MSKFQIRLFTVHDLSNIVNMKKLWTILNDPLLAPRCYDSVERAKIPFTMDAFAGACELYQSRGALFVTGAKNSFTAYFSWQSEHLSVWNFYINVKAMKDPKRRLWLEWIFSICGIFPVLYGFGCTDHEYDAKHMVRTALSGGGRTTGWVGVSTPEFYNYLPGFYWLNIFGAEIVMYFGGARLLSLEETTGAEISGGQIALYLNSPVEPANLSDRLTTEAKLASALGTAFFFDRSRADIKFEAVPTLRDVLGKLRQR
jgi:hypothetical protein